MATPIILTPEELASEEWRAVPGHTELLASNLGRIKRPARVRIRRRIRSGKRQRYTHTYAERILVNVPNCDERYLYVGMRNVKVFRYIAVHRLVCAAFHGPANGLHCNHKNGNGFDNRANNVEWVTRSQNIRHAIDVLGRKIGGHNKKTHRFVTPPLLR
jgi:hypothetical protein